MQDLTNAVPALSARVVISMFLKQIVVTAGRAQRAAAQTAEEEEENASVVETNSRYCDALVDENKQLRGTGERFRLQCTCSNPRVM